MTSPTTPQLEKAIDMAVEEKNQVTFQGEPRLAVIVPCRGRPDLTAIALRHIGKRLEEADFQDLTLVTHSGALMYELALGVQNERDQPQIRTAAATALNAMAAWGLRHASPRNGFTNEVLRLRAQYGLLQERTAPVPKTPEDPRVLDITGRLRRELG